MMKPTNSERSSVERGSRDGRIDQIGSSDTMSGEKSNDFSRLEPSRVHEPHHDSVGLVDRAGSETFRRRSSRVDSTSQEIHTGSTRALGETNRTGKLNEIASGDVVRLKERGEEVDGSGGSLVVLEIDFLREEEERAVGARSSMIGRHVRQHVKEE